jgi:hypothetical protein
MRPFVLTTENLMRRAGQIFLLMRIPKSKNTTKPCRYSLRDLKSFFRNFFRDSQVALGAHAAFVCVRSRSQISWSRNRDQLNIIGCCDTSIILVSSFGTKKELHHNFTPSRAPKVPGVHVERWVVISCPSTVNKERSSEEAQVQEPRENIPSL